MYIGISTHQQLIAKDPLEILYKAGCRWFSLCKVPSVTILLTVGLRSNIDKGIKEERWGDRKREIMEGHERKETNNIKV